MNASVNGTRSMIEPTQLFALPPDLQIRPIADLNPMTRSQLANIQGDYVIFRRRSRQLSSAITSETAELLEWFRTPHSIPEAVFLQGRKSQTDPRGVLKQALPVLEHSLREGWLVPKERLKAPENDSLASAGDVIEDFSVTRRLRFLDDTEIYQVRFLNHSDRFELRPPAFGLLKLFRHGKAPHLIEREAEILEALDGHLAPRLLRRGELDGEPYLLLEWCQGSHAIALAALCRERGPDAWPELLALCQSIADAYADLHGHGLVHGDLHGSNLLVDGQDGDFRVRLVDFELARWTSEIGEAEPGLRAGLAFFLEPEAARQYLDRGTSPPVTEKSEQYALGALLYRLVTGVHTHDFTIERQAMLRQIATESPVPWAVRGVASWPELESLIRRALDHDPDHRFESVAALAEALRILEAPRPTTVHVQRPDVLARRAAHILEQTEIGNSWAQEGLPAPAASVKFGAAGVACALLRMAGQRDDPELLERALWWSQRAEKDLTRARAPEDADADPAFYHPENGLKPEIVGTVTPYHTSSGVYAVRALTVGAIGNYEAYVRASTAFTQASQLDTPGAGDPIDLVLGPSGNLLAAALLHDFGLLGARKDELLACGHALMREIWADLDRRPPLGLVGKNQIGMAHGWPGALYAALQWHRSSGMPLPATAEERLEQLADLAEPEGRGMGWGAETLHEAGMLASWCNGTTGHVFLWSLAGRLLGRPRYFDLALAAGWSVWEDHSLTANLCCGLAGRTYALLHLAKHSGDGRWLDRARVLAHRAAASDQGFDQTYPHSLYRGELILAVLASDLERPGEAAFPFFEEEGWDRSPGW